MRKSIKSALLSALIFPGVGHFSLKRYRRGMVFFLPSMTALLFQLYYVWNQATELASKIEQGDVPVDVNSLSALVSGPPSQPVLFLLNLSSWILLVCWLGSIFDSYRLGKLAVQEKS